MITLNKSYFQTSVLLVMSPVTLVTLLRYYGYYGECDLDSHCSYSTACYKNYCRDPCIGACGYNANCKVSRTV